MTDFSHQRRSGKHKRPKQRKRKRSVIGFTTLDQFIEHRELEYLRRLTGDRWYKLQQAPAHYKRGKECE